MPVDGELFRAVVGSFPTGVAIVTTLAADGSPRGLVCNALCSVSSEPPMLLVCIDKRSRTGAAIEKSRTFVVNVLRAGREALAMRFAATSIDRFEGVVWRPASAAAGAPVLADDSVASAECVVTQAVDAGDHWVFFGRIDGGAANEATPLMYFRRVYAAWPGVRPAPSESVPLDPLERASHPLQEDR